MLNITNLTKTVIDEKLFAQVAKIVLKGENRETKKSLPVGKQDISVVFVNSGKIEELNRKYRKIDKPTDVLSFNGDKDFLGEIVICPVEVRKNASSFAKVTADKKELVFVFIHGILHLLGYDHELKKADEEEMQKKESYYLSQVNL